jgi:hypothetical protein
MRTFVITSSCLALVALLTSFAPLPWKHPVVNAGASISTQELTLAAGSLDTSQHADAH